MQLIRLVVSLVGHVLVSDTNPTSKLIITLNYVYVWYHNGNTRITVILFYKITVDHRDSDISTVIPNMCVLLGRLIVFCISANGDIVAGKSC